MACQPSSTYGLSMEKDYLICARIGLYCQCGEGSYSKENVENAAGNLFRAKAGNSDSSIHFL